jgi:hypothetical protein
MKSYASLDILGVTNRKHYGLRKLQTVLSISWTMFCVATLLVTTHNRQYDCLSKSHHTASRLGKLSQAEESKPATPAGAPADALPRLTVNP